jgi:hypothetical protein
MQNCNGFAEVALRHYLIMPTHHPTADDAAARADAQRLKMPPSHPPRQPLDLFDKSGSSPNVECMWSGPEKHGTGPQTTYGETRTKKQPHFGRHPRSLTGALRRVSIHAPGANPQKTAAVWA